MGARRFQTSRLTTRIRGRQTSKEQNLRELQRQKMPKEEWGIREHHIQQSG